MQNNKKVINSVSENYAKQEEVKLTEKEKLEIERKNLGPKNFSRKRRRQYLKEVGALKTKKNLRFGSNDWVEWYNKTRTEGKRLHDENTEQIRKQAEWYLDQINLNRRESLIEYYTNLNLSVEEVSEKVNIQMDLWS
jgi:hypothetical protein